MHDPKADEILELIEGAGYTVSRAKFVGVTTRYRLAAWRNEGNTSTNHTTGPTFEVEGDSRIHAAEALARAVGVPVHETRP